MKKNTSIINPVNKDIMNLIQPSGLEFNSELNKDWYKVLNLIPFITMILIVY